MSANRDRDKSAANLLIQLGNTGKAIPYYALFKPDEETPHHFGGQFLTANQFLNKLNQGDDLKSGESVARNSGR